MQSIELIFGIILVVMMLFRREGLIPATRRAPLLNFEAQHAEVTRGGFVGLDRIPRWQPAAGNALEVRGMTVKFGGLVALNNVDITVPSGGVVAVIGPNGSGKSTLFNAITGLVQADGGSVKLHGDEILGLAPHEILDRGVARTFQNIRLFPNLTVLENVLVGQHARLHTGPFSAVVRPPGTRAEEEAARRWGMDIIGLFGNRLTPRANQTVAGLSYANRRRVEISRALASRPKILLLDEPTAGMNPAETLELAEQIKSLHEMGLTILLIEHKLDVVTRLADKVVVLDHGEKIAEGRPEEVRRNEQVLTAYLGRAVRAAVKAGKTAETRAAMVSDGSLLLEFKGINTHYGDLHVLKDVNYTIGKGEIVSLLGGNASGKSTTMKTIMGVVRPTTGSVSFEGQVIDKMPTSERVRRGIAPVLEARRLFPRMTVYENLEMGAFTQPRGAQFDEDLERVYSLFPRVKERLSQLAGTLSGGEQQMVAIGRALMARPRLLCMDEPSMGLSPLFVELVFDTIVAINKMGMTIFMVEQNANMALSIAHRAYVLQTGQVVLSGTAADLKENPSIREAYPASELQVTTAVRGVVFR